MKSKTLKKKNDIEQKQNQTFAAFESSNERAKHGDASQGPKKHQNVHVCVHAYMRTAEIPAAGNGENEKKNCTKKNS